MSICNVPPHGWLCTREPGHSGPCAAVPADEAGVLLYEALSMMKEFCRRVEAGEVRSHKTYNKFKIFIAKAEFTTCLPSNTN